VIRKLISTAANSAFDSLQYLHSAGAWDTAGRRFALATVRDGRPALVLLDVDGNAAAIDVPLAQFDEVYSPTWSPDGRLIAFAALIGGATDLFVIDLATTNVRRLTNDQFADVQPAWSPDGRSIAFATDRFSTRLGDLRWGALQIAVIAVDSGVISRIGATGVTSERDPAWSADGSCVFFVGDHADVSNVFRFELAGGRVFQVTDVETGVSGVTRLSPALSVAAGSGRLAYSVFNRGGYEIHTLEPTDLKGQPTAASLPTMPESDKDAEDVAVPQLPEIVDRERQAAGPRYRPRLGLEAFGMPYFSAGGGAFGSSVQGGSSFLFGDLLGDRQLFAAVHLSSLFDESAFTTTYLDRGSRWNWGLTVGQVPEVGYARSTVEIGDGANDTLLRTRERRVWTERALSGFTSYPLDRWRRIEFSVGARQNFFEAEKDTDVISSVTGRLVATHRDGVPTVEPLTVATASVALVGDTAVWGGTGPILGSRYRFQILPAGGETSYLGVLADYRRYLMPVKPYTIALRILHSARYGPGKNDPRLLDTYLGSSSLVRGYSGTRVVQSECSTNECAALDSLLGTGVLVAKLEIRAPLLSAFSSRIRYGAIPLDMFAFADGGTTWGGPGAPRLTTLSRTWIRSVGGGVRANAMGVVFDFAAERALDLRHSGWRFAFNLRPGY
jgi:hypothetical protein